MGTFFKQIYRYTHHRRLRHNENLWPYNKITRDENGHITKLKYRSVDIPVFDLTDVKDTMTGRILILTTGPSVNETPLQPFFNTPVMGVNGAWFINQPVNFTYYVIIDMVFFDKNLSMIKEVIAKPDLIFFTTLHGMMKIIDHLSVDAIKCKISIIEDACCKIFQPRIPDDEIFAEYSHSDSVHFSAEKKHIAFNTDIRTGIFDAGTVAYWALQIAVFAGASEIVFAGLDMNNFEKPRFYETIDSREPSFLYEKLQHTIIPAFTLAGTLLKNKGITLKNLSQHSAIDDSIISKVKINDFE